MTTTGELLVSLSADLASATALQRLTSITTDGETIVLALGASRVETRDAVAFAEPATTAISAPSSIATSAHGAFLGAR